MRPLGLLIIDGLSFLEENHFERIYNILKDKDGYQLIIFTTEIPSSIDQDKINIINIKRNPLLRELDELKNSSQTKISTFF